MLTDNHGRDINYLRLAVTDRCNLRCSYCMPAEGIRFLPRRELLSDGELLCLVDILSQAGITKLRITGGEPFVRPGLMDLLESLVALPHLDTVSITTNATLIGPHIARLQRAGIRQLNVSLDALDAERFGKITRRDCFATVYANLVQLIEAGFRVKINCIVLDRQNTDQIVPLVELTRRWPVSVRFLEEMPFNGSGPPQAGPLHWNHHRIYDHIARHFPALQSLTSEATSTAQNYRVPGYRGTVGIIAAFSRTFCGSCSRLRVSARGELRTCLYAKNELSFRTALRAANPERAVNQLLHQALNRRFANGHNAEQNHNHYTSMTSIGG